MFLLFMMTNISRSSKLPALVNTGGHLICDSIDVSRTDDPIQVAYVESNLRAGRYPGQRSYSISFAEEIGESFKWLHLAQNLLARHFHDAGLTFEVIHQEPNGSYLSRIGI